MAAWRLAAAFAAGAALNLAFAPFAWWPLAALLPAALFALIRGLPPRRAAWVGAAFGAGLFAFGTYWLYTCLHVFGLVPVWLTLLLMMGLVAAMATFPAGLCYFANRFWPRPCTTRDWLVLPALWVLLEWLRGWILSGFPWLSLGYAFIDTPLAGWAPLLGVYGVTWVAVCAAVALSVVFAPGLPWSGRLRAVAALGLMGFCSILLSQHAWTHAVGGRVPIAAVQGAVSQDQKWQINNREATLGRYANLTSQAWGARLILWPEAALPVLANNIPEYLAGLRRSGRTHGADFAIGLVTFEPATARYFNGLLVMTAAGDGWYYKRHLVPFGEYFPVPSFVRSWMRLMSLPFDDISAGSTHQPLLRAAGQPVGVTICYEDAFGSEQLDILRQATLLINVTNNAWFGDSTAPHQHLQISRMRALEAGRYLVRATNDGITAGIGPRGEVLARLPQFKEAVLQVDVQPMAGLTPYARCGNYPVILGALGLLGFAAWWPRKRGRTNAKHSSHPSPTATGSIAPNAGTERLNTKAAGVIGLAVMCSRVLGLAREQVCAALFGGGGVMDAFTAAFRIPNLLRDLFAEGALSTAFVTTFSKTIARSGDEAAWRLANKVATLTLIVLGAICVAGMVFSSELVGLLAPGFGSEKAALTAQLTRIMFPFIVLVSMAALVMGMLNAKSVFGTPAMASSFFNIGSIVGGVTLGAWIDPSFGPRALIGLALGTLIGGALQFAVQLPPLSRLGYRYKADFRWRDPGVSAILGLMGPSVIAASTTQFNVLVNSMFASTLGDGAIFWLAIAFRLMQLPLGLFGVALGTVTLPLLSRLVVAGHMAGFRSELAHALRLMFLLTIPSTVGLMILAEPIISVLYQHGKFDAFEAAQAAGALRFYAIGLGGYAALKVLVNAFYALDRRKTPMMVSMLAVGLNLLFNWIFTFRLHWGHLGLAFSTGCVATCNFSFLYFLMSRHLSGLESRRMLVLLGKVAVAAAALAAVCLASMHWLLADWARQAFPQKAALLFGTIVIGGLSFAGCGAALRIEEFKQITAAVMRRARLAG